MTTETKTQLREWNRLLAIKIAATSDLLQGQLYDPALQPLFEATIALDRSLYERYEADLDKDDAFESLKKRAEAVARMAEDQPHA